MSLPTTSKSLQSSIRSFFQPKSPQYAPPPSKTTLPTAPPTPNGPPQATTTPPPPPPLPAAVTGSPSLSNLPHEATIRPITSDDVNPLRRINALLLQVSYPDVFYERAIDPAVSGPFSRVITWEHKGEEPKIVGGVVCRVEPQTAGSQTKTLYIQSLCILSPYRSLGLINAAVDSIIATAAAATELNIKTVTAHVWTENDDGLQWYEKRGFQKGTHPVQGYYMKLRPDTAWFVYRDLSALPPNSAFATPPSVEASTTAAVVNLPSISGASRPPPASRTTSGQSYQNKRADMEWNDLPADMAPGLLGPPRKGPSEPSSGETSRSSSAARKKRDRSYPAAAFGS